MKRSEELKNTMAAVFTQEPAAEPQADRIKPRRRSLIDKDPLPPEPKRKRNRRKKDPAFKKSYSMTVLMTREMHERFKNLAEMQGLSMNGIVTRLIRKYIITHDVDLNDL